MHSLLGGTTYGGRYVAADARHGLPSRPEEAKIHFGPAGFVLMAPLPDERWIMFVNVDEPTTPHRTNGSWRAGEPARGPGCRHPRCPLGLLLPDAQAHRPPAGRRPAVPVGRCRSSVQPVRRRGTEHGAAGRRRHRLETGLGPARCGTASAAEQLRDRARLCRRARAGGLGPGAWDRHGPGRGLCVGAATRAAAAGCGARPGHAAQPRHAGCLLRRQPAGGGVRAWRYGLGQPPARAFRSGAGWRAPAITSWSSATPTWTSCAPAGPGWSRCWTGLQRASTPPGRACRRAVPCWSGRTA